MIKNTHHPDPAATIGKKEQLENCGLWVQEQLLSNNHQVLEPPDTAPDHFVHCTNYFSLHNLQLQR